MLKLKGRKMNAQEISGENVHFKVSDMKLNASFKNFASRLTEGVYVYDAVEQNILYWNKYFEGIFSCLNGNIRNFKNHNLIMEVIHPEDRFSYLNQHKKYQSNGFNDILQREFRIRDDANGWKWVRSKESVIERTDKNSPKTILGLIEDVTYLKEELEKSKLKENYFRTIVQYSTDIITLIDINGIILFESPSVTNVLGYNQDELIGKNAFDYIHKEDLANALKAFKMGLVTLGKPITISFRFRKKDGSYVYLESTGTNFTHLSYINGIIINSRDVSNRKRIEKDIKKLNLAVEQSSNTVVITDINGNIEYVNKKFVDLTGYSKEEAIGKNPRILKSNSTSEAEYSQLWETILSGKTWEGEFKNKKKNGEFYWESVKITPVLDANDQIINFIAIKDDITTKKIQQEQLQKNLEEKELMLREIHHRVKNNLQIVNSLLNLQRANVDDTALKAQLIISQNRVKSMALIHQLLFKSENLNNIEMENYLFGLSSHIMATYGELSDRLTIKINCKDIHFSIETAVPFGLLVNELITNSLNNCLQNSRVGEIDISLYGEVEDKFILEYNDNGIGNPLTVVNGHVMTSGMYLIDSLVIQLDGQLIYNSKKESVYKVLFKDCYYKPRLETK